MSFIRQKLRPKHQVLILKCYPQTVKGAVDVKPNSSELSYLLYYATNRRSKLQKVGTFLEKKTESDVYKARIGNVQVTLGILAALVEKAPRDLPLYAPFLLGILNTILNSNDITMVESSIHTFQVFCEHHDAFSLSADSGYLRLYELTIRKYASFASPNFAASRNTTSRPLAVRWRTAGLQAIKSVASSEALASVAGRQLDIIMPALLDNIWTTDLSNLNKVIHKVRLEDKTTERVRRMSNAVTQSNDSTQNVDPRSISNNTAEADKLAEEEVQVLAMSCLRQMFIKNNRSQIRAATVSHIKYVTDKLAAGHSVTMNNDISQDDRGWATTIFVLMARWTPVQDRYVILVTAMDSLVRSPVVEENLLQQLVLAIMIDSLLKSDINLIGLSVMDILVGLIQHILRVLQLNAAYSITRFHHETQPTTNNESIPTVNGKSVVPSGIREHLLERLEQCVGALATHIYYADQISDMITALFLRLKPPVNSAVPNAIAAIEDPDAATAAIITSAHIMEDPETDGFFSFDTAKITALSAIKSILDVATRKSTITGAVSLGRNKVGLKVWEGTQWLLRDPDGRVRKAYVDALLTWLDKEMTREDLKAMEEKTPHRPGRSLTRTGGDNSSTNLARRAVSNASRPEMLGTPMKTSFLQLLHLAVYDNAVQYAESEADTLLLHLLLSTLVNKLGVNAVSSGLPMIFRLQEDIQDVETLAKVRIGSICHGYFWMLTDTFDFGESSVAHEIYNEIARRRDDTIWVESIRVPPIPLSHIGTIGIVDHNLNVPIQQLESLVLKPFDDRETMIELIALSYSESMTSAPSSPSTSPTRNTSRTRPTGLTTSSPSAPQIPTHLKETMLAEWSREAVLAHVQNSGKAASVAASRAGTQTTGRHFLGVLNGNGGSTSTSIRNQSPPQQHRSLSQTHSLTGSRHRQKKMQYRDHSPAQYSDSSKHSIARFDHLKRVLAGQAPPSRHGNSVRSDASSESLVSYDGSQSEFSLAPYRNTSTLDVSSRRDSEATTRSKSRERRTSQELVIRPMPQYRALSDVHEVSTPVSGTVPPVPPLPEKVTSSSSNSTFTAQEFSFQTTPMAVHESQPRISKSRGGQSTYAGSVWGSVRGADNVGSGNGNRGLDLEGLLKGIDTKGNAGALGGITKPPY